MGPAWSSLVGWAGRLRITSPSMVAFLVHMVVWRMIMGVGKIYLDSHNYTVRGAGFEGVILAAVTRDLERACFLVEDKRRRHSFRLTNEEQELVGDLADHLPAFWKAPDFYQIGKARRRAHGEALLEDAIEAVVEAREGETQRLEKLKTFNHRDFVEHMWKVCGLRDAPRDDGPRDFDAILARIGDGDDQQRLRNENLGNVYKAILALTVVGASLAFAGVAFWFGGIVWGIAPLALAVASLFYGFFHCIDEVETVAMALDRAYFLDCVREAQTRAELEQAGLPDLPNFDFSEIQTARDDNDSVGASGVADDSVEDDSTGKMDPDLEQAEAELVQKVQVMCQLAHMHIKYLKDDEEWDAETIEYGRKKFEERKSKAIEIANEISDEIFRGAALHSVIDLCCDANRIGEAKVLFSKISDAFLREMVLEAHPNLSG